MKKELSILLTLCLPLFAWAEQRSDNEVLSIVRSMDRHRSAIHRAPSNSHLTIAERTSAYVAVNTSNGFVLVGADDQMPEVIGWSDNGIFDRDNMPPALLACLNGYAKQGVKAQMNVSFDDERTPLLTTQWSQRIPYNDLCPASGDSTHCPTGCVATAMAQIMNYYQYPAQGQLSHSYKWACEDCDSLHKDTVTLTADFGNTTYVWNNMLDRYDAGGYMASNAQAVATLMYHCGVAVEMNYGAKESGAALEDAAESLFTYFGYGYDMQLVYKDQCSPERLAYIIHDDIRDGHPVLARGSSDDSGHAFVCDGFDSIGYFHVNWGWGGVADGYFLLSALSPTVNSETYSFNKDVCFITHICPDSLHLTQPRSQLFCDSLHMIQETVTRTGEKLNLTAYQLRNYSLFPFDGRVGIMLSDERTKAEVAVPWVSGDNPIPVADGIAERTGIRFEIAASVPNGIYLLDMVYQAYNDSVWHKVIYRGGGTYGVKIKITTNEITRILDKPDTDPDKEHTTVMEGALPGAFTINAKGDKAYFSQGNLQYNAVENEWRFAPNQYDYLGEVNEMISYTYDGWIDLFGWGTSGWNSGAYAYQPYSSVNQSSHYYPGGSSYTSLTGVYANADWGIYNPISNGGNQSGAWRTMTISEWSYLFKDRPNAAKLQASAVVNAINGYILLPDDFVLPNGLSFSPLGVGDKPNVYDGVDWLAMEAAGAVFMPCAGSRDGTELEGFNEFGRYWSASAYGPMSSYYVLITTSTLSNMYITNTSRHYGLSVRLVRSTASVAVESVMEDSNPASRKIFRDGQLLIIRGDKTYNAAGIEVMY